MKPIIKNAIEGIAFAALMFAWCAACMMCSGYHWE